MSNVRQQAIRNTFITYTGVLIAAVNLLFLQPYFLSAEELGLTRILFAFSSLAATFVPLGSTSIVNKFFPRFRNPEEKHYGFLGLVLIYGLVGFVLVSASLLVFSHFFIRQYEQDSPLFAAYFQYVLPMTFALGFFSILQTYSYSLYRTGLATFLSEILSRVGTIVISGLYFCRIYSLDTYVVLFTAIYVLQLFILSVHIWRIDKPSLRVNRRYLSEQEPRKIFWYAMVMWLAGFSWVGIKFLDAVMIGRSLSLVDVAVYSVAAFLPAMMEVPLQVFEKITSPRIAHALEKNDTGEIRNIYYSSVRYLLLFGIWIFLLLNLNADSILQLIPGTEYRQGADVVSIISAGTLINVVTGTNNTILFASDRYYRFAALLLVLLFVLVFVLNLFLIPAWGIRGAAVAAAFSSLLYNAAKFIFIWKKMHLQPFGFQALKIIVAGILIFAAVFFIPHLINPFFDLMLRGILITALFASAVLLMKLAPELEKYLPFRK